MHVRRNLYLHSMYVCMYVLRIHTCIHIVFHKTSRNYVCMYVCMYVVQKAGFNIEFSDPSNKTPRKLDGSEERVKMKIVEVDGLHRSLPNVRHLGET